MKQDSLRGLRAGTGWPLHAGAHGACLAWAFLFGEKKKLDAFAHPLPPPPWRTCFLKPDDEVELASGTLHVCGLSWGPVPAGGSQCWGLWLAMFVPLRNTCLGDPLLPAILEMLTLTPLSWLGTRTGLGSEDSGVELEFCPQPVTFPFWALGSLWGQWGEP